MNARPLLRAGGGHLTLSHAGWQQAPEAEGLFLNPSPVEQQAAAACTVAHTRAPPYGAAIRQSTVLSAPSPLPRG